MRTKSLPPPQEPQERRLTIPVDASVYETFSRIAKASKTPIGRAMGEWLRDTLDAAEFMADKMEQARAAPSLVARELHSYALGLTDVTTELLEKVRQKPKAGSGSAAPASAFVPSPRTVIRGGNLPKTTKNRGNQ